MYREALLENYRKPHNFGPLENFTVVRHEHNSTCGDSIKLYFKIVDNKIQNVSFEGEGCAISIAAASMLTDELKGLTLEEVLNFSREEMLELLGIPLTTMRMKCGMLCLHAAKKGICMHLDQEMEGVW